MRLTYHPEAEAELARAAVYYETRSPGLGDRFLREFDQAILQIQAAPDRWPKVDGDLRCYTLNHFPFGIYYRALPEELRILVIKHHHRHPDHGRSRSTEGL